MIDAQIETVRQLVGFVTMDCLGTAFRMRVERDKLHPKDGRIFLQVAYDAPCSKTGVPAEWKGRKWYLSEFMTDDEVIKTAFVAFESAVKHEILEGFKVNGIPLFNPHANYIALLEASRQEIKRSELMAH